MYQEGLWCLRQSAHEYAALYIRITSYVGASQYITSIIPLFVFYTYQKIHCLHIYCLHLRHQKTSMEYTLSCFILEDDAIYHY